MHKNGKRVIDDNIFLFWRLFIYIYMFGVYREMLAMVLHKDNRLNLRNMMFFHAACSSKNSDLLLKFLSIRTNSLKADA